MMSFWLSVWNSPSFQSPRPLAVLTFPRKPASTVFATTCCSGGSDMPDIRKRTVYRRRSSSAAQTPKSPVCWRGSFKAKLAVGPEPDLAAVDAGADHEIVVVAEHLVVAECLQRGACRQCLGEG